MPLDELICDECGDSVEEINEHGECPACEPEPCGTCDYDVCQCDYMYDNYRDSLLERD